MRRLGFRRSLTNDGFQQALESGQRQTLASTGTRTSPAATSALTVRIPSVGGQSSST